MSHLPSPHLSPPCFLPLFFFFILVCFGPQFSSSQETFQTVICRTFDPPGPRIYEVCAIFVVAGCGPTQLELHLNVSHAEVEKLILENNQTYSRNLFGSCSLSITIPTTPWAVTPTYAHFHFLGVINCQLGITFPFVDEDVVVGEDCTSHTDCNSCLQSGVCGWCQSGSSGGYILDKICYAENKAETQPFCGTCSNWIFNDQSKCPIAPPPTTFPSSSSTGSAGGGTTDDVIPSSSSSLSTGGAVALGFVVGGVVVAGTVGAATWWWKKRRGGRKLVKTEDDGVELRDGEEPLNDQKSQSDLYEAPKARANAQPINL